MAILMINGTAIPDPTSMQLDLQDIDASTTTRSADGTMCRDRVVGGASAKRKIELEWSGVKSAAASQILQAIAGEFFSVTYPDPYTGANRTAQFYAGDRSLPVWMYNDAGHLTYEKLSVNLIEK